MNLVENMVNVLGNDITGMLIVMGLIAFIFMIVKTNVATSQNIAKNVSRSIRDEE